jgi:phosphosulfolactate synthase (CoM biosynthesis protein A)
VPELATGNVTLPITWPKIEAEGITENVHTWRTDVVARIVDELGLERVMFEAADPESSLGISRTTAGGQSVC